ncbi:hypothetical protein I4F81_007116 [Pyropia yezoensis]|uniref:Uncharacterized protein n=1 Tax=Pyropia yezoensis TaxID=2788 RepID=A0ACC3C2Z1_PYRYE|nr:hypothetical protein I4F81_007116 [Neopyropia yezoensis]
MAAVTQADDGGSRGGRDGGGGENGGGGDGGGGAMTAVTGGGDELRLEVWGEDGEEPEPAEADDAHSADGGVRVDGGAPTSADAPTVARWGSAAAVATTGARDGDGGGGGGGGRAVAAATGGGDELHLGVMGEAGAREAAMADEAFPTGGGVLGDGGASIGAVAPGVAGRGYTSAVVSAGCGGSHCAATASAGDGVAWSPSGEGDGGGGGGGSSGGDSPLPRRFARMTRSLSHILWTTGPAVLRRRRKSVWAATGGGGRAAAAGADATVGSGSGSSGSGVFVAGVEVDRVLRVVLRLRTSVAAAVTSWARRSLGASAGGGGLLNRFSSLWGVAKGGGRPWDRPASAVAAVAVPLVLFWVLLYGLAGVGRAGGGSSLLMGRAGGGGPRSLLPLSGDPPRWPYAAVYEHRRGLGDGDETTRVVLRVRPGAGAAEVGAALTALTTADFGYDLVGLDVWFPPPTRCGGRRRPCAAGGRGDRVDAAALAAARAYHWRFGSYRVVLLAPSAAGSGTGAVAAAMLAAGAAATPAPPPSSTAEAGAHASTPDAGGVLPAPPAHADPLTLFLDSAVQVSPHFYTWLSAAAVSYGGRPDVAGYTLLLPGEDESPPAASMGGRRVATTAAVAPTAEEKEAVAGMAVLQQRLRWAAYAPAPTAWRRFRTYAAAAADPASALSLAALPPPPTTAPDAAGGGLAAAAVAAAVVAAAVDDGGVSDLIALYARYMAVMDLATVGLDAAGEGAAPRLARQLPTAVIADATASAAALAAAAATAADVAAVGTGGRRTSPSTPSAPRPAMLLGALSSAAAAAGLPALRDGLLRPAVVVDMPAFGGGSASAFAAAAAGPPRANRWAAHDAAFAFPANPGRLNWGGWPVLRQDAASDAGVATVVDAVVAAASADHPTPPHVLVLTVGADATLLGGLSLACHFSEPTRTGVSAPVAAAAASMGIVPTAPAAPVVVFAITSPDVERVLSLLPPLYPNGTTPLVLSTPPTAGATGATARRDALVGALLRRGVGVSVVDAPSAAAASLSSALAATAAAAAAPPPGVDVVGTLPLGGGSGGGGGADRDGGGGVSSVVALAPTAAALRLWHTALRVGATGGPVVALPPPPGGAGGVRLGLGVPPDAPGRAAEEALVGAVLAPPPPAAEGAAGDGGVGGHGRRGWVWHTRVKACVPTARPPPGGSGHAGHGIGGGGGGGEAGADTLSVAQLGRELAASAAAAAAAAAAAPPAVVAAATGGGGGGALREEVVVRGGHRYLRTWRRVKLADWARAHPGGVAGTG